MIFPVKARNLADYSGQEPPQADRARSERGEIDAPPVDSSGARSEASAREVQPVRSERGDRGHKVWGQYEDLEPGAYEVCFRIAALDEVAPNDDDPICAVLDVVSDAGTRDIAASYVAWSQLGPNAEFWLRFDLHEPRRSCEYRVYTTGAVGLLMSGRPVLTRRGPPLPADQRLPWRQSTVKRLWQMGIRVDLRGEDVVVKARQLDAFVANLLKLETDRRRLAEQVVESVGYNGMTENSLYRAFVGTERVLSSPPQPVPFASSLCHQAHFGYEQYRFWAQALKETPKYQRKQWEFVYIAQALYERGYLRPGNAGLVFGAGEEQLPALFASMGVRVLATDQAPEQAAETGWVASSQYTYDIAALNKLSICSDRMFGELVSFRPVDMNDIPPDLDGRFDFCWSACALEHLGSLEHGLAFMERAMRTLRPGGLAVHTTEFNLSSNGDTIETPGLSIYRRRDIEAFIERMTLKGFEAAPIDWELGEGFAETVVDLAPYLGRGEPHLRLRAQEFDVTSIGLIIRKPEPDHPVAEPVGRGASTIRGGLAGAWARIRRPASRA